MIPKLDWRRFTEATDRDGFVKDLSEALRGPGILRLAHHGIERDLIDRAFADARALFDLTEAEKRTLSMRPGPHNRGWSRLGAERLANGAGVLERREAFNIGLDLPSHDPRVATRQPFRSENIWPALPGFRDTMLAYFDAVLAVGMTLHRAIAIDLGLPEDQFEPLFTDPLATLRLIIYPPGTGRGGEAGAGPHTDCGAISLLMTDSEPGLQAQLRGGDWVDVDPDPESLVILVGDVLECWSGGTYAATPHRVLMPANRRQSITFYLDPGPDVPLSAFTGLGNPSPHPKDFASYLAERIAAAHIPPQS